MKLFLVEICLLLNAASFAQQAISTDLTGDGQPHENMHPFTTLVWTIATDEDDTDGLSFTIGGAASDRLLGEVRAYTIGILGPNPFKITQALIPPGWMLADGSLLQISEHPLLFSILGNTYGGDGTTTFALPNLMGRTPVGVGAGPGLEVVTLGQVIGQEQVTITSDQIPAHLHATTAGNTPLTGGGEAHENRMPSLGLHCLIASAGTFPSRNKPGAPIAESGSDPSNRFYAEVRWYAGQKATFPGFEYCEGQTLPINGNEALFSLLGTNYGGDGRTSFGIPDLRGRILTGTETRVGTRGGASSHTISAAEMPIHSHQVIEPDEESMTTGESSSHNNQQPFLELTHLISVSGQFTSAAGSTVDEPLLGEVTLFAGSFAMRGYVELSGQTFSTSQNSALFSLMGTHYGGDEAMFSTFSIPDLDGSAILGQGLGDGLSQRIIGDKGGEKSVTLNENQLPEHRHGAAPSDDFCIVVRAANGAVISACL